ncbi:MAG: hypothetical protein JST67_00150 [Bacteroidetes bacterium]|nr:hypothetical protein [Bacteroidota bacterium]
MSKKTNLYYLLLLTLFMALVWLEYRSPKPINWSKTYGTKDKIPFGCNAFYRILNEDVLKGNIKTENKKISEYIHSDSLKTTALFFLHHDFYFNPTESKNLLSLARQGASVFIAACTINGLLADTFSISTQRYYSFQTDSVKKKRFSFFNPQLQIPLYHYYPKEFDLYSFVSFDTSKAVLLAEADKKPVFLKINYGEGAFYFLSTPDIYCNYFIVNKAERTFAYKTLSYLKNKTLVWNEYAPGTSEKKIALLQFLLDNPSLYAAYVTAIIALVLFMVFALKRRQRAIAIIEPVTNTTMQFVEVIGNVYYNSKNHRFIAEEKIQSFYHFLRQKFSINATNISATEIQRLSKLSEIPEKNINDIFNSIQKIQEQKNTSEKDLIQLNEHIAYFYKHNKR